MVLDLIFLFIRLAKMLGANSARMKCLVLILLLFIYLQYCQNNQRIIKKQRVKFL